MGYFGATFDQSSYVNIHVETDEIGHTESFKQIFNAAIGRSRRRRDMW